MKKHSAKTTKITISIPISTLKEVELVRGELDIDRSSAILSAILLWLNEKYKEEQEMRYAQGYKKIPERVADIEALYRAGLGSFTPEEW